MWVYGKGVVHARKRYGRSHEIFQVIKQRQRENERKREELIQRKKKNKKKREREKYGVWYVVFLERERRLTKINGC